MITKFSFLIPLMLLSCVPQVLHFSVGVDSLGDASRPHSRKFFLYPGMQGISPTDLQFREFSTYVEKALVDNGFESSSPESAAVVVFIVYGIGDPQVHSYSYSVPIIGRTDPGQSTISARTTGSSGTSSTTATITPKRTYGVVGSQTYSGTYATYLRYLVLEAIDLSSFKRDSSVVSLWRTTVTSHGSSDDLRLVMPYMIVASRDHIATNTLKRLEFDIREDDPRVKQILLRSK